MSSESDGIKELADFLVELSKAQESGRDHGVEKWGEQGSWHPWDKIGPYYADRVYRVKYTPQVWWMNIYPIPQHATAHATKEEADESATSDRMKCVKVMEVEVI